MVARRAAPFGFRMLAYDPYLTQEDATPYGVTLVSLEQLLAESDLVTVHTFLAASTRHLINRERLLAMKPGGYLINTARGPIVDEAALIDVLRQGHLGRDGAPGVRERRHRQLDSLRQQGGVGGVLRVDLPAGAAGVDHPPRHLPTLPVLPARGQGGLDARGHWRSVLLTS